MLFVKQHFKRVVLNVPAEI